MRVKKSLVKGLLFLFIGAIGAGSLKVRAAGNDGYWDEDFGVPGAEFGVADVIAVQNQLYVAGNLLKVGNGMV
jgi:hypothetical protein